MRLAVLTSHPIQYQVPLFRALSQRPGVDFTALFCHPHGVEPSFDKQFGRIIRYDVPLLEGYTHRFLRNVAPKPALSPTGLVNPGVLTALARNEFEALVVHGYASLTNLLALLGPRRGTRILMRGDSNLRGSRTLAKRAAKQMVLRKLFARVDQFLLIGSLNRAYYSSYGVPEARMTFAPFSVDNDHFASGSAEARRDPTEARQRLGLPLSVPLFLFCSKLSPRKRPLDVLRAFARVVAQAPSGLVYVGDGALAPELESEIQRLELSRYVHRLGFRNQSELPAIYGACDVLVLPSDDEPWGLVVNEAMAAGMAAVVSERVGAGPDLVEPNCIFPTGDVAGLAEILLRLAMPGSDIGEVKSRAAKRIESWGLTQTADAFVQGAKVALDRAPRRYV